MRRKLRSSGRTARSRSPAKSAPRILLAGARAATASIQDALRNLECYRALSLADARLKNRHYQPAVIILDLSHRAGGWRLAREFRASASAAIFLMSYEFSETERAEAEKLGLRCVLKPFNSTSFKHQVNDKLTTNSKNQIPRAKQYSKRKFQC